MGKSTNLHALKITEIISVKPKSLCDILSSNPFVGNLDLVFTVSMNETPSPIINGPPSDIIYRRCRLKDGHIRAMMTQPVI